MDIEPGTVVANRYRISRPLGRGGMGEVFAAENIRTGRPVAVKLLRSDTKAKSSAVARFRQEARAAGSINSDHVTQVLDVEEDAEHGVVLVFELLEGESLIDRLKRTGPIPFDELHTIIEQVWMGLADAHKIGIVHRDLKPSNVFLEHRPDGTVRVKILDFGISKLPKEMGGETLTEMGQSLGTFSFMPPEQIGKAKTVDHRADIYACATMIYQSLTGQLPYSARNILVMVEMKAKADARKLTEAMGGPVDPRLESFVAQGLARDPANRFQTAIEALSVWRDLRPQQRATQDPISSARTDPSPQRSTTPAQRPLAADQQRVAPDRATMSEQRSVPSTARSAGATSRGLGSSRPAPRNDNELAATIAMPPPHLAQVAVPEEPPRIEPRLNAGLGAPLKMGVGGTQPVRVLRPVTPVSPTAQANSARSTGTALPNVSGEKPPSERSGQQNDPPAHDDPKSSGRAPYPSSNYYGPQSGAAGPPSSGQLPPSPRMQSTPPSGQPAVQRVYDESTGVPGSSSEGATQVYRPHANDAARLKSMIEPISPLAPQKRSSPWTFLLGAIAFLLVGFFIVAAIMRFLAAGPR